MKGIGHYLRESRLRYVGGVALGLVLGVGYAAPAANAQYHDDYDRNPSRRLGITDLRRVATINGYSDGFEHGTIDRRNGESFNFRHSDEYQRAATGYDRSWGSLRDYQASYRDGYAQGYADSYYGRSRNRSYDRDRARNMGSGNPYDPYSSYPGYSTSSPYGSAPYYNNDEGDRSRDDVARAGAQNGYTAGFERGQYDAQNHNRPNPQGHGAYQFGFDGFDPSWGSASVYQQSYRSYFVQGYQDGFNRRSYDRRYYRQF